MTTPIDPHDPGSLIGRIALVGLTYLDGQGGIAHRLQVAGPVVSVSGGSLQIDTGAEEPFTVPYDPDVIQLAVPGFYAFRDSEGGVENPDILMTWTIYPSEEASQGLNERES